MMYDKGITKSVLASLKKVFPDARPKIGETLEEIHRREGQQDVLAYIQRTLVND